MYTYKWNQDEDMWEIIDPMRDVIFYVSTEEQAEIAISHLNRG